MKQSRCYQEKFFRITALSVVLSIFASLALPLGITQAANSPFIEGQPVPVFQAPSAPTAAFTSGNIVIYRVGSGSGALTSSATPVFLDEYSPSGTLLQSIALPTAVNGLNKQLTANGTATSEGLLTRSTNGQYLLLPGYAANPGVSLSGVTRVVGRVDWNGNIDTTTAPTDFASTGNPRSAVSTDGSALWMSGSVGGARYTTLGATTSTQLATSPTNLRQINIFDGQLYVSASTGSYHLATVGTGLPTTSGQTITNLPPNFPTTGSQYGYFFADLSASVTGVDTVYVAADDSNALTKYSLVTGSWTSNGTIGTSSDAYRGLTGKVGCGAITLYATRKGSELVTLVDSSGYNGAFSGTPTLLATAATYTAFRGVAPTSVQTEVSEFAICKNAPASVYVNQTFTYTLSVMNDIGVNATGVVITDSLPISVTFQSASDGGQLLASNVVSWTVPTLADNASVIRTVSVSAPGTAGILTNADYGVWASSWLTRTVGTPFNTTVRIPSIITSKAAPPTVDVNTTFSYTLSIKNDVGVEATGVVITDSLPVSLTFQSASDGGVLLAGNVVSWTIPILASEATTTRNVWVTAPASEATLTNSDYGAWASNWITRTLGSPVNTTVYNPSTTTPIGTARLAGPGWYGTIQGKVTVPLGIFSSTYQTFAIQDDTGGMYVYAPYGKSLPPMVLGDVIQVYGKIKNFNGLLEIDPLYTATWIDSGTVPAPLVTATSAVNPTQGKLIQVTGTATWTGSPPSPGADDWDFSLNDGSGPVKIYVDKDTGIDMLGYTSPMSMTVIGFSSNYDSSPEVLPRFQSDIIDLNPPAVTSTDPANSATGVSLYRPVTANFNKAMSSSTIITTSFTLTNSIAPVNGVVSYESSSHKAVFTPNAALLPSTVYTATLTTDVKDIYDIPLAAPYTWSFTTGLEDTTPPDIVGRLPLPDAVDVALTTNIVITFTEDLHPSSLNQGNFILEGPFGSTPYAMSYNSTSFVVTLNPGGSLLPTSVYTVTVKGTTADWAGLTLGADDIWNFTTSVEPPMAVYLGDIHNHTGYSDGSKTPAEALAAGETAGFDFMAITDHSYAISDSEWENTLTAVNAATDSDFVALRGFEYTQGAEGHINVYNSETHATRTEVLGCDYCDFTPNLEQGVTVQGFYNWLTISGTIGIDEYGTVMQFNHPGWINFNDWAYHSEVSATARLEEVGNGNGTSYMFSEDEYLRSLDYGWKVGATNNADTHTTEWGTNTDHRTGVIMAGLTKPALLEALRERRTYATEDKNFTLTMKANGAWMGSEIANSGSVLFEIEGADPDSEITTLAQLITDQGTVAAQVTPNQASFSWQPQIAISTGVHYFYVKATQSDGDRIVSSPVWTMGDEDISITDIIIQPTVPTTNNPSLLTARVTNRVTSSRTVTVTMDVDGVPLTPSVQVIVPANGDAYANFSWQPSETGDVTVTATLQGAPAGDNPDDNSASLSLNVTDEVLPLILIDAGKNNTNAVGREMRMFIEDLSDHGYNVLKNLDSLTADDLDQDVVKLLIITAPQYAYSADELSAIADYVEAGGSLWLCGLSDYTGKVPWADTVAGRMNAILARIEQETSTNINMRMNDDEVIDGNTNNGYAFGVRWSDFPSTGTTSIGVNVENITSWSLNSIRGRGLTEPLTSSTPDVQIVVQGDLDVGYTSDTWHNPFHTSNTDADEASDAYIYNPTWAWPYDPPDPPGDAIRLPMAAVTDLDGDAGRIMLYGDSSDAFTTFAYTAGDGLQNELFNLEAIMWLLGEPLQKSTIAEARAQAVEDQPDNLDRLVWVEGKITAAYGEFFNVLYVQDDTGGITVHAPAGDIDSGSFTRGTEVRVVGTIGIYGGDTEIEFFEAEMVQVINPSSGEVLPLPLTTYQASLEENQGWLGVITGTVTTKTGNDTLMVDDGSGPARVFIDGYNGDFDDILLNDLVRVTGLISEDGNGGRIRVRNYQAHPAYADDVVRLPQITNLDLVQSIDKVSWPTVEGSLSDGFDMILNPAVSFYYLDVANVTTNEPLAEGYHPFYVDTYPANFFVYWDGRGVNASADPLTWQGVMWRIINGELPIFYLKASSDGLGGQLFRLVDGMVYQATGTDEYLRLDGTYLRGEFTYTGSIEDADGFKSPLTVGLDLYYGHWFPWIAR